VAGWQCPDGAPQRNRERIRAQAPRAKMHSRAKIREDLRKSAGRGNCKAHEPIDDVDRIQKLRGPGVCQRSRCAVVSLNACLVRVRAFQEIRHE